MPQGRDDHTCCMYNDEIILFGGYEDGRRTNDILRYKITQHKWTKQKVSGPRKPCERAGHSAVVCGELLIIFAGTDEEN